MPKQAFFNLTESKQATIMQAVFDEFEQTSFCDASINRIIKTANISRGSFYLYFEDKEDVYQYLLCQLLTAPFYKQLDEVMSQQKMNIFDFTVQCFSILASIMVEHRTFWNQVLTNSTADQLQQLFHFKRNDKNLFEQYHLRYENLRFKAPQEQQMLRYTLYTLLYRYLKMTCQDGNVEGNRSLLLKHLVTFKIGWQ